MAENKLKVLYEDNHLIAVFKPAGVLTQGDKSKDKSLIDWVKKYLKEKYHKQGKVFLGLIHRLDRPVCGIIIFAKTSKGASRLSAQFRNRKVEKIYHALVIGKPKRDNGLLINYLVKDNKKNIVKAFDEKISGSQEAELYYEVIKSDEKYSLLKVNPLTGRPHQIRAQLAAMGNPIVGDLKYGAPFALPDKSIALCATEITFITATGEERKTTKIEVPEEWKAIK